MVLTGLGLVVPGLIYLVSWPDTVKAMALVLGPVASPLITGGTITALLAGGVSFIAARSVRPGSVLAAAALICGSVMHSNARNSRTGDEADLYSRTSLQR